MIQAAAGFFVFVVALQQNGFHEVLGLRAAWEESTLNDLSDSYGQEWVLFVFPYIYKNVVS